MGTGPRTNIGNGRWKDEQATQYQKQNILIAKSSCFKKNESGAQHPFCSC